MSSFPAQYFGSATPIVNQTNVGPNTLSAQVAGGGGGSNGVQTVTSQGNGSGIIVAGTATNPTIATNFVAGSGISLVKSVVDSSIQINNTGGGGGPNPVVSTLTAATYLSITNDTGSVNEGGIIWPLQAGTTTDLGIGLNGLGGGGQYGNSVLTAWTASDYAGNPGPGEFAAQRMYFGNDAAMDNAAYIERASTTNHLTLVGKVGDIDLIAPNVNISSLSVSSINGAAPGGAVGPTISVSSITNLSTINDGTPGLLLVAGDVGITGGYLAAGNVSTNTISPLNVADLSVVAASTIIKGCAFISQDLNVSSINGAPPSGGGNISTFNQVFTSTIGVSDPINNDLTIVGNGVNIVFDVASGLLADIQFQTSTVIAVNGNSPSINCIDQGNQNYIFSLAAGYANITTSISSLNVSSINGASPSGGGSTASYSNVPIPGGVGFSTFICDPGVGNLLVQMSTISSHVYTFNVGARAQILQDVTIGDDIEFSITANGGQTQQMGSVWAPQVSTMSAGGLYTFIGGTLVYKAEATTDCYFDVRPSVSTQVRVDTFDFIDNGPI